VVAQEVKKLAVQTEDATRQIGGTIQEILERGDRSVASIRAMGEVMEQVDSNQGLISRTMPEQEIATRDVQGLVEQMKNRSEVIATSIDQLSSVAESAEEYAAETDREAHRLLELATQIAELTSRLKC
jgi:methyl-accepting chemotaxis protein